jgi:hypothetical protein
MDVGTERLRTITRGSGWLLRLRVGLWRFAGAFDDAFTSQRHDSALGHYALEPRLLHSHTAKTDIPTSRFSRKLDQHTEPAHHLHPITITTDLSLKPIRT